MGDRVRVALDVDIEKGDTNEIVQVLYERRKQIMDYICSVVLINDDRTSTTRVHPVGGNTHRHSKRRDDMPCDTCREYSRMTVLSEVDE